MLEITDKLGLKRVPLEENGDCFNYSLKVLNNDFLLKEED